MKTVKVWHSDLGRYFDVDAEAVQKVKDATKRRNDDMEKAYPGWLAEKEEQKKQQSFFYRVNIIDLLFKLFVFTFIFLPLGAWGIATLWWSFGIFFVYALAIMFVLVVLCYLSQVPASQLTGGFVISTFIKAIVMTPIALIGSFFVAKAPKGTAVAGGIVADMVRDAGEIINKKGL